MGEILLGEISFITQVEGKVRLQPSGKMGGGEEKTRKVDHAGEHFNKGEKRIGTKE